MRTAPYKASEDRIEGRKFLAGMAATVKACWARACEADGIPVDSVFVVWSEGNKFAPFYDRAMAQYLAACCEYEAGGYVGLRLVTA
jgi:hypothetical protein